MNNERTAFHIAILGMDGAGKSTLVEGLFKSLNQKNIRCKKYYLGMYRGFSSKLLSKVLFYFEQIGITSSMFLSQLIASLRWILIARKRLSYYRNIKQDNKNGIMTVSDRYPIKNFWSMPNPMDGPRIRKMNSRSSILLRLAKWEENIYLKIKEPEVLICLQVDLEKANMRHTDAAGEDLTDKNIAISKLISENDKSNFHVIDVNELNQQEVLTKAFKIIEMYNNVH
jgi:hypothetical protein